MDTENKDDKIEAAEIEYLRLVGLHVRDARKSRGLSQEQISELCGLHPTYISKIESGTNASLSVYRRLAAVLKVPLVQLLDVNAVRIQPDALTKLFGKIRSLPSSQQRMVVSAIKGLLSGVEKK